MTIEQAKQIIASGDISTKEKKDEYLKALQMVSGNPFTRQN